MIDLRVDDDATEPPFEQVRRQLAAAATSGRLEAGARLPTVRALAAELGLAVNTVARAYRTLEADGVVETRGRQGTFVRGVAAPADLQRAAADYALRARRAGLTRSEAHRLVEQAWSAQ